MHGAAGLDAAKRRLAALPGRMREEAQGALRRIGEDVVAEARAALRPSPVPSLPGEAPADPSGDLAASLTASLDPSTDRLTVAATSPHALFLEYGTRRMGARPFLRPAVESTRATALRHCAEAAARAEKDTP